MQPAKIPLKSILLIDDDEINNFINCRLLNSLSIAENTYIAKNGREGIIFLKKYVQENSSCPDIIFLDINMPLLDGFEFFEEFNSNFSLYSPAVVILTNSKDRRDLDRIKALNIKYLINKPLSKEHLSDFLMKAFEIKLFKNSIKNTFPIPIIPPNDEARVAAVKKYQILGTGPEKHFDEIVEQAAKEFDVPFASVSIVDEASVFFKANYGMPAGQYIDRGMSLCAVAILQSEVTVFSNAVEDPCLISNPFVHGEFGLRFYAGAPLTNKDGHHIGTLCVVDTKPRNFSFQDKNKLASLAKIAMQKIEERVNTTLIY